MRVLLDTNILLSGLIFLNGNEHQILRLLEENTFTLILPETVTLETRRVLARKFEGFEDLLDLFLAKIKPETLPLTSLLTPVKTPHKAVRDEADLPLYIAILQAKPDYVVTGDEGLREDLNKSEEIRRHTRVCSSKEFLTAIKGPRNT